MVAKKTTKPTKKTPATAKKVHTAPAKTVATKTTTSTKNKKGLLNFLFSFNGNISKELFLGSTFILTITSLVIDLIFSVISNITLHPTLDLVYGIIMLLIALIGISIGYKRAHSLGISGFYSIVGTVICKPFFAFFKPTEDKANDSQYAPSFTKTKKLGAFFGKTTGRQLLYIVLFAIIALIPYSRISTQQSSAEAIKSIIAFIICIAGFNIIQIIILDSNWLKKYYAPIVKVLSFFGYTFLVIGITVLVYSTYILMAMLQAIQYMPN
ncbi:MAG: hypothetical protein K2M23_01660 [Alphaproteobacteria bacterium]|nr:hypothetical protein [Alphaproteobacteria bacterium]